MKLLLIFPPYRDLPFDSSPQCFAEESGNYPPLGLLSLATSIKNLGKYEVKIIDSVAEGLDYPLLAERIKKENPQVVGITFLTDYLRAGVLIAKMVKNINPEIKIIVGGPHVRLFPYETIKIKEIDYVVAGEADYLINEIMDRIYTDRTLDDLPSVLTKTNYERKKLVPLLVEDLNSLPIPDRRLLPYKKYKSVLTMGSPITIMLTSRGCPFKCPYCSGGGIKPRFLSPKRVVEEIKSCLELGIKDILFFDELFTLNKERVLKICDEIINQSIKVRWHARARIDTVDREMLRKMRKAGCRLLQFGIETSSQRMQKILKRNLDLNGIRNVIKMAQDEGILTYGNFMFNLPYETVDEMYQTIDFAIELNLDYAVFGVLSVFPKTEYYFQVLKEKKIEEDFWQKFAENPLTYKIKFPLWPGEYTSEFLNQMVQKAYSKFYIRPRYIFKAMFRKETISQKVYQLQQGIKVLMRIIYF